MLSSVMKTHEDAKNHEKDSLVYLRQTSSDCLSDPGVSVRHQLLEAQHDDASWSVSSDTSTKKRTLDNGHADRRENP